VVHEDADILVVDKPHGILSATMAGQGSAPSVFSVVKDHVRGRAGDMRRQGGRPLARRTRGSMMGEDEEGRTQRSGIRVWIIHRLDREASGLMVFAKNLAAFDVIKEELRARRVQRTYVAVVEGQVGGGEGASGSVQSYITEDPRGAVLSTQRPPSGQGGGGARGRDGAEAGEGYEPRLAVTHYRVAACAHGRTMLELRLDTGRKHQIRVHARDLGHPIVGDRRYGAATDPLGRVCLHARTLAFAHPRSGVALRFESATPGGFVGLIGRDAVAEGAANAAPGTVAAGVGRTGGAGATSAASAASAPSAASAREGAAVGGDGAMASRENAAGATSWDHVAEWYENLIESRGSDHHERVIIPGTLRLLEPRRGLRVLDVACGEGALCRRLAEAGADALGVDASPRLIRAATKFGAAGREARAGGREAQGRGTARFAVADATRLDELVIENGAGGGGGEDRGAGEPFDAACCVMALMNISPLEPALAGIARRLKPGGRFVGVVLHPAFRAPGQTSWGWDVRDEGGAASGGARGGRVAHAGAQFRRVDAYLSPAQREIVMNPGAAAHGAAKVTTTTYHRPLQTYVRALAQAGFAIDALEEWASARQSQPGPRAQEEDRARREIPMFLAVRAIRLG
jgi:23S rRNA-/tRNA-specific pseudouridylate synthase/SAM-dependent methyltransferase